MATTSHFLIFALTCIAGIHLATQEVCEPGTVINLKLNGNGTLSWESPPEEACEIGFYLVYVTRMNGTVEFSYMTLQNHVDVGHLTPCDSYNFKVHQVSTDNVTGSEGAVYSITPPPTEADLTLAYLNLTQVRRNVRLQFSLQPEWISCAKHYQILIYDEDTDTPRDVYTGLTSLIINDIVPCSTYQFGVRAIFALEDEGPMSLIEHTGLEFVTTPPVLTAVSLNTNSVQLTWHVESYSRNRCAISKILLDGSPNFNVTKNILDQPNRAPVNVVLTSLSPDSLYYLRTSVVNTAGASSPAFVAVQTLPLS